MMLDMYASAPADVVYAVTYRFPGGSSWTLHRTLASATGKVGGILGQAPGEWYRCEGEYRWKLSPAANCPALPVNGERNEGWNDLHRDTLR